MVDPNPIVASKGIEKLRNAGVEVIVGVEEELSKKLNEAWIHQMLTGKPFVIFAEEETSWQQEAAKIGAKMVVSGRKNLLSILEPCKQQGFCSVLLDLMRNSIDFEGILREADVLNLFQKFVVEMLPVWNGSTKDLLTSIAVNLKVKNLTSAVSDETILLEGYFVIKAGALKHRSSFLEMISAELLIFNQV